MDDRGKRGRSMRLRHALILAHGDRPSIELLRRLHANADVFIATDGAANWLIELGLLPDVVLGDFDSLAPGIRDRIPGVEFVQALDQEASDLEKAIEHALASGCEQVTIVGGLGGRIDHTLAGFSLLAKYCRTIDIKIVADGMEACAVTGRHEVNGDAGDTLSLVPFEPCTVSLVGAKWPLHSEALEPGSRGVSNVIIEPECSVEIESGTVIMVVTRREFLARQEEKRGRE